MTPQTELVHVPRAEVVSASDFMPVFSVEQAIERKQMVNQFIGRVLIESEDYGAIPGASKKKVLLKPGAEKLCSIFGLTPSYNEDKIIEDWTGADHGGEPLFYYSYRCQLSRGGRFMGEAIGSCNSWESKYRYRWVGEEIASQREDFERLPKRGGTKTMFEPTFAIDKAETTGKYGKPAEYWQRWNDAIDSGEAKVGKKMMGKKEFAGYFLTMDETQYRIPNPEVPDTINTCQKMAQKRALVAAVLVVTNCSDAFTQDIEDFEQHSEPTLTQPVEKQEMPSNLPPELQAIFMPKPEPGAVGRAFEFVKRALAEVLPENGAEEYQRILEHNGIKPGKGNQLAPSRNAVMQCWTQAQALKRLQKPKDDLGVNMSDMPYSADRSVPDDNIDF